MSISVIIPVRNEAECLPVLLRCLRDLLDADDQLVVADGDSDDGSAELAQTHADVLTQCRPGRARQMNAGAEHATGEWLWFLHADAGPPCAAHVRALRALSDDALWGRFDVRLGGHHYLFPVIGQAMNWRSRWTQVATGDQGVFVRRRLFRAVGGFPDMALMEDVALSKRLRRQAPPVCLRPPLTVDSRRWQTRGVWRTVWLMWQLRLRYWCGADPARLQRDYHG